MVREVTLACPTAGDPPQPWSCYEYQLLECQTDNCVDADGDGFPRRPQAGETCVRDRYDCKDDDPDIKPSAIEDCHDTGLKDEDCDGRANCEDQDCWAGQTAECDAQCDKDNDGYYKATCGGDDCDDDYSLANPGYPHETAGSMGNLACSDGHDNNCAGGTDCADATCAQLDECQPQPTPPPPPTPTPGGGDDGGGCPCGDCTYGCGCECGDCINGCEPNCDWVTVEGQCYGGISEYWVYDPYTNSYIYYPGEPGYCDPPQQIYVCW